MKKNNLWIKNSVNSQNLILQTRERLGYYMYRNFGVVAPRSNHALVYINDVFSELCHYRLLTGLLPISILMILAVFQIEV